MAHPVRHHIIALIFSKETAKISFMSEIYGAVQWFAVQSTLQSNLFSRLAFSQKVENNWIIKHKNHQVLPRTRWFHF